MINYFASTNNSGYSQSAISTIQSIIPNNQLQLHPINYLEKNNTLYNFLSPLTKTTQNPKLNIFHSIPDIQHRFLNKNLSKLPSLQFAIYEATTPPKHWNNILNKNAAILTPSNFCLNLFKQLLPNKQIFLLPHPIPTPITNESQPHLKQQLKDIKANRLTFTFIGTFKQRKGIHELLHAWFQSQNKNSQTLLFLKTDSLSQANSTINELKQKYNNNPNIHVDTQIYSRQQLDELYQYSDYIILPTKGEGFCLPALEALYHNKKLIITDYSGQQDFCNKENSILLQPESFQFQKNIDNYPQFNNQYWPVISPEQIAQIIKNPPNINTNNNVKELYSNNYIYQNYFSKILNYLNL